MRVWTFDDDMVNCVQAMHVKTEQVGDKTYLGNDAPDDVIKAFLITLIEFSIKEQYGIEGRLLDAYDVFIHDSVYNNPHSDILNLVSWCFEQSVNNLIDCLDLGTY